MSTSDGRDVPPALDAVRDLLRRGALDDAQAIVDMALARAPDDAEALYLRALVANRRRDHPTAIAALRRSVSLRPAAPLAWLALGNALARADEHAEAMSAYREVLAREPGWADARYNLGLMQKRVGDLMDAVASLHAAWTLDPMLFDAGRQCVSTIAQLVRNGVDSETINVTPATRPTDAPSFTIVICSIDDAKCNRVVARYRTLFAQVRHEIVTIRDARSLADAYNRAAAHSQADVLLMSHDDVDVLAEDFADRLIRLLQHADVVGVAGSTRMDGPAIGWSGHPYLRGWITHHAPGNAGWRVDVLDPRPVAEGMLLLDGVMLAARRRVVVDVPFDAVAFDGFHLYDLDWTCRVARAGFRLAAAGELMLVHASRGAYGADWQRFAARFCAKYATGTGEPAESAFFGATLDNTAQVRAFFMYLARLAAPADG